MCPLVSQCDWTTPSHNFDCTNSKLQVFSLVPPCLHSFSSHTAVGACTICFEGPPYKTPLGHCMPSKIVICNSPALQVEAAHDCF